MWLPKDERRMLREYYPYLRSPGEQRRFVHLSERAYTATQILMERGLVHEITDHAGSCDEHVKYLTSKIMDDKVDMSNLLSSSAGGDGSQEIVLKFTPSGRDLARKYAKGLLRTQLWWAEYRDHWLFLILAYLLGILSVYVKAYIMPSDTLTPEKVPHMSRQAVSSGAVSEESTRAGQDPPMQLRSRNGEERELPSD